LLILASHVLAATVLTASFHGHVVPLATTSNGASKAIGGLVLIALALFGFLLAVVASALRGLAATLAELLRFAAVTMAVTAMVLAVILALLVALIHH
jgi:hypothetical protein